jgi:hypothetical protein
MSAVKEGLIKNMSNPLAIASLGLSGAGYLATRKNMKINERRIEQAEEQHNRSFNQQERLIRALRGVETGLNNYPTSVTKQPKKDEAWLRIKGKKIFSEKRYGDVTANLIKGSLIGSTIGSGIAAFAGKNRSLQSKAFIALTGSALGGLAGALWGTVKALDTKISQLGSGHKLMDEVIKNLNRAGYKRDSEWTTDPKKANIMKTKVCVVFSRSADELGLMINMASEPELKKISEEATKNLPWGSKATEKISDRFNEIQITSLPSKTDAVYIFGKIEKFIQAGYPVYLIEVG